MSWEVQLGGAARPAMRLQLPRQVMDAVLLVYYASPEGAEARG